MTRGLTSLFSRPPRDPRHETGRRGERLAARWLRRHRGYRLIARNVRRGKDEADLLMRDRDGTIVVVEVRTRAHGAAVRPEETVTPEKQRRLSRLAQHLVTERAYAACAVRFDVVAIDLTEGARRAWWRGTARHADVRHYPDAFPLRAPRRRG